MNSNQKLLGRALASALLIICIFLILVGRTVALAVCFAILSYIARILETMGVYRRASVLIFFLLVVFWSVGAGTSNWTWRSLAMSSGLFLLVQFVVRQWIVEPTSKPE